MKLSARRALADILAEAAESGVTIHSDTDAVRLLDWFAAQRRIAPEKVYAVTLGSDIFVRPEYARNVRVLREEMIHVRQQRAGIAHTEVLQAEVDARLEMISKRHRWGITNTEAREMIAEIRSIIESGRY